MLRATEKAVSTEGLLYPDRHHETIAKKQSDLAITSARRENGRKILVGTASRTQ